MIYDIFFILKEMGGQLRKIKVGELPKYENQQLLQRFTSNPNQTSLNLGGSQLTDQDMEIVANQLETNKVSK